MVLKKDSIVTTPTELLKSLEAQQLKYHVVQDLVGRDFLVFEAPIDAKEGEPCLCTEYAYLNATSTRIISFQERQYRWKKAWEVGFTFDPNVDYDPDGDGVL